MSQAKLAYVRVSTKEQNIDRQINKMRELGVEERFIFVDKASGKDFNREQYQAMRSIARKDDLIYLDSLDRLGRNYDEIIQEWKHITRSLGADIVVLDNETLFDSRKFKEMNELGKLMEDQFLSLLAYVAEQERSKILVRQKEGIAAAKAKGKHLGRPAINLNSLSPDVRRKLEDNYECWVNKELTSVAFAKLLGLKKNTFYKIVEQYKQEVATER